MEVVDLSLTHVEHAIEKPLKLKGKKVSNRKMFSIFLFGVCLILAIIVFLVTNSYIWSIATPILCYIIGNTAKLFFELMKLDFHFKL